MQAFVGSTQSCMGLFFLSTVNLLLEWKEFCSLYRVDQVIML